MKTLNLTEAAAFLGLHPDTLRERAGAATIPGAKIGKEWRFLEADLVDYFRGQYRGKACRSTSAGIRGGLTFATAGEELDALLERASEPLRSGSTTNLRLVSGKKSKRVGNSLTPSSHGSKRGRAVEPS